MSWFLCFNVIFEVFAFCGGRTKTDFKDRVKAMEEGEGTMGLSMLLVLAVCLLSFKVLTFI